MAVSQADGSIILETKINSDGIKIGLNDIRNATENATATFNRAGKTIQSALESGNARLAEMAAKTQKTSAQFVEQAKTVEKLKRQIEDLQANGASTPALEKMKSDLAAISSNIASMTEQYEGLSNRMSDMLSNAEHTFDLSGKPLFSNAEDQAYFDELYSKMQTLYSAIANDTQKASEMSEALKNASGAETQKQVENLTEELNNASVKLNNMANASNIAAQQLKDGMNDAANSGMGAVSTQVSSVTSSFEKMGNRILRTAKTVLFFGLFRRAFTGLRNEIGNALMSNEQFRASIEQLTSVFWTLAAPLYEAVLPALNTLINALTKAMLYLAVFIGGLQGKSLQDMIRSGKALRQQAKEYEKVSKSSDSAAKSTGNAAKSIKKLKEETEETNKELAEFDELLILQSGTIDEIDPVSGGVSSPTGTDLDDLADVFDSLSPQEFEELEKFSKWVNENKEWLGISLLVTAIGGLIWKILDLLGVFRRKDRALENQTKKTGDETSAVDALSSALATAGAAATAVSAANELAAQKTDQQAEANKNLSDSIEDNSEKTNQQAEATKNLSDSIEDNSEKTNRATSFIDKMERALVLLAMSSRDTDDTVSGGTKNMHDNIVNFTESAKSNIAAFTQQTRENLESWAQNVTSNVGVVALNVAKSMYNGLVPAAKSINSFLETSSKNFAKWGMNIASSVANAFRNVVSNIGSALSSAWNSIKSWATSAADALFGNSESSSKKLTVSQKFASVHTPTISMNWVGSVLPALTGISGLTTGLSVSAIPLFARGGVANRPTLGVFGENGREAVLPLENNTGWMDMLADRLAARMGGGAGGQSTVILEIDGREFGRASVKFGNNETRRIGTRMVIA